MEAGSTPSSTTNEGATAANDVVAPTTQQPRVQAPQQVPGANDDPVLDADARSKARTSLAYKTGGVVYSPMPKTGQIIKRVIELSPDGVLGETKAENMEAIDILYRQLSVLLKPVNGAYELDDASVNERANKLQLTLDLEDARAWMAKLLPQRDVEAAGEEETAS